MPINPRMVKWEESPAIDPRMVKWDSEQEPKVEPAKQNMGALGNIGMGALKGASDIGATLLTPVDWALNKTGLSNMTNDQRRQSLASFFSENADPESMAFKGGELATDVAGTAGAGGLIVKGAKAVPVVANAAPKLLSAVESGGFKLGAPAAKTIGGKLADAATRATGGAVTGGLSAGMIDPETAGTGAAIGSVIPMGAKAAGFVGSGAKKLAGTVIQKTLGLATGAGDEAIKTAFSAGKAGNQSFLDNMRGKVNMTDILDDAKSALTQLRIERSNQYAANKAQFVKDQSVIDFTPINDALNKLKSMGSFKGQQINKNAAGVVDDLSNAVDDWAKLDPKEFHTPEGLDALKQKIGDIRDVTQFGTPARRAADEMYNAVKKQITDQAPEYSKMMKDYSEASELITEIQKAFSLGEKTSKDTAMRKLQSLMRNNVNTNYGNRLDLAKELETKGGKDLLPAIAGQALNSATPRGLQGVAATGTGLYGMTNPAFLAALPFQSPRLMGEASYALGRMGGAADSAMGLLGNKAQWMGLLGNRSVLMPMMTIAPSVYLSQ